MTQDPYNKRTAMQLLTERYPQLATVWRNVLAPYLLPSAEVVRAQHSRVLNQLKVTVWYKTFELECPAQRDRTCWHGDNWIMRLTLLRAPHQDAHGHSHTTRMEILATTLGHDHSGRRGVFTMRVAHVTVHAPSRTTVWADHPTLATYLEGNRLVTLCLIKRCLIKFVLGPS